MADTPTPNYGLNVPTDGADDDVWGVLTNENWATLDTDLQAVQDQLDANDAADVLLADRVTALEPAATQSLDETGLVGSWLLNGTLLSQWGTAADGISQGLITFPKRYKDGTVPTLHLTVATGDGTTRIVNYNGTNAAVIDPLQSVWAFITDENGDAATGQVSWTVIGVWDEVS